MLEAKEGFTGKGQLTGEGKDEVFTGQRRKGSVSGRGIHGRQPEPRPP